METVVAPKVVPIWTGSPPGTESWTQVEKESLDPPGVLPIVRNVTQPTLTIYPPTAGPRTRTAVVVCPGGAFHFLAYVHEGIDVARWLNERGVTALLLKYRVAPTSSDEEEFRQQMKERFTNREADQKIWAEARRVGIADGQQALRVARELATELDVDRDRIGIMGFSAGATVTTAAALLHDAGVRPNFAAPIYGAPGDVGEIPADAPPLFIALAADDAMAVGTSLPLFSKWREAGKSAELHVYARGGHGFGMRKQGLPVDSWIDRFGDWLGTLGLLDEATSIPQARS
jgi:acetyl esterase/lipase